MEKLEKRIGQERNFLNLPYETSLSSCISYTIKLQTYSKELIEEKKYDYCNIQFSMSDCSRNIYLEFNIETKDSMRNSLHKLDTIIGTCQKMKEDLKEARLIILDGHKRKKELDLEKKK